MKVHIGAHIDLHYAYIFNSEGYLVLNISNFKLQYYKNKDGYDFYRANSSITFPEDIDFILDSFSEMFGTEKLLECLRFLIEKNNREKYNLMLKSALDYIENILEKYIPVSEVDVKEAK